VGLRDAHDGIEFLLEGLGRRTAVGCLLFRYRRDTGQGGDQGCDFVGDRAAEGAFGLQGAEFIERAGVGAVGSGTVTLETVQGLGYALVQHSFDTSGEQAGFIIADSPLLPGGEDQLVERKFFQSALRVAFLAQGGLERIVFFLFVRRDDGLCGRETVLEGV
jgi:hypothetical protein